MLTESLLLGEYKQQLFDWFKFMLIILFLLSKAKLCFLQNEYTLLIISIFLCYLFIHIRPFFFSLFWFYIIIMESSKAVTLSKALAFKKFKYLLYKCYPKFVKAHKNQSNSSSSRMDNFFFFYFIGWETWNMFGALTSF